jgi:hypothetical protein
LTPTAHRRQKGIDGRAEDNQAVGRVDTDPAQSWFWTEEWQAGEREADAQIAAGEGSFFASGEEFLAALEAENKRLLQEGR